jgi:hypothetical protein
MAHNILSRRRVKIGAKRTRVLDEVAVRRYLTGVEHLAREGRLSDDPRVLLTGLAVLARQTAVVEGMLR